VESKRLAVLPALKMHVGKVVKRDRDARLIQPVYALLGLEVGLSELKGERIARLAAAQAALGKTVASQA